MCSALLLVRIGALCSALHKYYTYMGSAMKVVAVASTKGGVGKTTLAAAFAVCAAEEGERVALVDLDPQESLAWWWGLRGQPDNPTVYSGESSAKSAIEKLANVEAPDWVILDGPPGFLDSVAEMVDAATLVVIPTKTGMIDILGSEGAVATARKYGAPFLIVLNDVHTNDGTDISAKQFMHDNALPLAEAVIPHRVAHIRAMSAGKTAAEVDRGRHKEAAKELVALWKEVKAATNNAAKAGRRAA